MTVEKCPSSHHPHWGVEDENDRNRYILGRSIFTLLFVLVQIFIFVELKWLDESDIAQGTVPQAGPESNRTLVVVIGSLRGGEYAWNTLAKNVLDPSAADLALCIGKPSADNHAIVNSSLYKRAKHVWTFKEYDDWGDAIDLLNVSDWRELLPLDGGKNVFGGVEGYRGSGAVQGMVRWFLSNHIKELDLTGKYERFMITRSDHYYQCMHNVSDFEVGNKTLWIPPGQNAGGKTDRHLIVGSEDVLDAIDIFPTFFTVPHVWTRRGRKKIRNGMNFEQLLDGVWEEKNMKVNYFDRVMFTCGVETDTTRWKKAREPVPGVPGLFKKYKEEYDVVQENCPPIDEHLR